MHTLRYVLGARTCTYGRPPENWNGNYSINNIITAAVRLPANINSCCCWTVIRHRDEHCYAYRQYHFQFVSQILLGSVTTDAECVLDQSRTLRFPPLSSSIRNIIFHSVTNDVECVLEYWSKSVSYCFCQQRVAEGPTNLNSITRRRFGLRNILENANFKLII